MQSPIGLNQELEVYSKGLDEMEWNFSKVAPPAAPGRRGSATAARPISSYGLANPEATGKWMGHGSRKSVVVGNGFGGFLAIPQDGGRPRTSGGEQSRPRTSNGDGHVDKRASHYDIWR